MRKIEKIFEEVGGEACYLFMNKEDLKRFISSLGKEKYLCFDYLLEKFLDRGYYDYGVAPREADKKLGLILEDYLLKNNFNIYSVSGDSNELYAPENRPIQFHDMKLNKLGFLYSNPEDVKEGEFLMFSGGACSMYGY